MKTVLCFPVLAALALAAPATAHHSYAMFDREKDIVLTGTVKDWQWTNPHSFLVLSVTGDQGKVVEWGLEGSSPQVLRGRGWQREMVKPGDKVTVHLKPLKAGTTGGQLSSVAAPDGHIYN
jgi:hypothetical protein